MILPGLMDTPMAVDNRAKAWGQTREEVVPARNAKVPLGKKMGMRGTLPMPPCSGPSEGPRVYYRCLSPRRRRHDLQDRLSLTTLPDAKNNTLRIDSRVTLADGNSMPLLGLGTWAAKAGGDRDAVAKHWGPVTGTLTPPKCSNERDVGEPVRESTVPRAEIFFTPSSGTTIKATMPL
ncbi:MAG: hypothetical protein CM1200mP20_03290 [Pseudomonadota bacterium]|nr:MAG: hypothetical protein CM1200mP20_03290 [Pseudomonadota bacterium]